MATRIRSSVARYSDEQIQKAYFRWLSEKVGLAKPGKNYRGLANLLHKTNFYSVDHLDDDREEDGKKQRQLFVDDMISNHGWIDGDWADGLWLDDQCSVLEMMVALADRIDFYLKDGTKSSKTETWFWKLVTNMGMIEILDETEWNQRKVDAATEVLSRMQERRYSSSGHNGGLFPLNDPQTDQRRLSLWYQMMAYLDEVS